MRLGGFRGQLMLLIGAALCGIGLLLALSLIELRSQLVGDRMAAARQHVAAAVSVLERFHGMELSGELSREQAQARAAAAVGALRWGGSGYLWINDMHPRMVMHPVKPELNGKDLSSSEDPAGKRLFVAFVDTVRSEGRGFVDYLWPQPGSDQPVAKTSFVQGFAPWGWVVGSGVYLADVQQAFLSAAALSGGVGVVLLLALCAIAWWVARRLLGQLGGEPVVAVDAARAIAAGDLQYPIEGGRGGADSILGSLSTMQQGLRGLIENLLAHARQVTDGVNRFATASTEVSIASQLQSGAIAQSRDEIERAVRRAGEVVELAEDARARSSRAAELSGSGEQMTQEAAAQMESISCQVGVAAKQIRQLDARAQQIGRVAQVIREIAEQTNLLALNAAIEAARAGEQGRGFAVVADEVRSLAERTSQATQEIGETIATIQNETRVAVAAMEDSGPLIETGVGRVGEAAVALQSIRGEAQQTLERIARLVEGTTEQHRRFEILRRTMEDASEVSQRSEHSLQLGSAAVVDLERTAQALIGQARRFQVDEPAAPGPAAGEQGPGDLIPWVKAMELGLPEMDAQHQRLVDIINRLHRAVSGDAGDADVLSLVDELMDYTRYHFQAEEDMMRRLEFSDLEPHRRAHMAFAEQAQGLAERARRGEPGVAQELLSVLRDWLVRHIMVADRRYARELEVSQTP